MDQFVETAGWPTEPTVSNRHRKPLSQPRSSKQPAFSQPPTGRGQSGISRWQDGTRNLPGIGSNLLSTRLEYFPQFA
jgi:hypothetical protein